MPSLRDLTETLGPVTPPSLDDTALALRAAMRHAQDVAEAERFRAMLRLGGAR